MTDSNTATQVRRPWRTTVRTAVQVAVALVTLLPFVVTGVYGSEDAAPAIVGQVLVVTAAVSRVMAIPQVEEFLNKFGITKWLAAEPE